MVDKIPPSTILNIDNYPDDLTSAELFPQCIHQNYYYVCANDLYYICLDDEPKLTWKKESPLPFVQRNGQSMTSTPSGIVFFGGQDKNIYYNDLWIFNKPNWDYVTCDIPVRANHAAACDKNGNLIICGGFMDSQHVLHDLYIVNLKTQVVTELNIPFFPKIIYHSLTALPDGTFILFGSKSDDSSKEKKAQNKSLKKEMYILNVETSCVKKIMENYQNTEIDFHSSAYIYGNLFICSRNNPTLPVFIFNFEHNIFIPYYIQIQLSDQKCEVSPIFFFTLNISQHMLLYCISHDYKQIAKIPIFSINPPTDYYQLINRPDYIEFMAERLKQSKSFFEKKDQLAFKSLTGNRLVNSRRNAIIDSNNKSQKLKTEDINETFSLMDQLLSLNYLLLHANKVLKLIEVTKSDYAFESQIEKDEKQEIKDFVSVHDIVSDLMSLEPEREKELSELDQQCSSLVNEIENCTFQSLISNFDEHHSSTHKKKRPEASTELDSKKKSPKRTPSSGHSDDPDKPSKKKHSRSKNSSSALTRYERMLEDSQQLAQQIIYERQKCTELTNERKKLIAMKKKDALFDIYDHLWNVSFKEMELKQNLESIQTEYFNTLSETVVSREMELTMTDRSARSASKKLASMMALQKQYQKLQDKLKSTFAELSASVSDLIKPTSMQGESASGTEQQIGLDEQIQYQAKIMRVDNSINSLNQLMNELSEYFQPPDIGPQSAGNIRCIHNSPALKNQTRTQRGRPRVSTSIYKPKGKDKVEVIDDLNQQTVFTPFEVSIGNEMCYLDDLERIITRIEDKLSDVNTIY